MNKGKKKKNHNTERKIGGRALNAERGEGNWRLAVKRRRGKCVGEKKNQGGCHRVHSRGKNGADRRGEGLRRRERGECNYERDRRDFSERICGRVEGNCKKKRRCKYFGQGRESNGGRPWKMQEAL